MVPFRLRNVVLQDGEMSEISRERGAETGVEPPEDVELLDPAAKAAHALPPLLRVEGQNLVNAPSDPLDIEGIGQESAALHLRRCPGEFREDQSALLRDIGRTVF